MKFDIQRLRNITTGILHTRIGHVYEDLGMITGDARLMTHMLGRVMDSVKPWLRKHLNDGRFWNEKLDETHTGEIEIPDPSIKDRAGMFKLFREMPNPLEGKKVISVVV